MKKILLIDDDADLVEIHKSILAAQGYEIETAYNGDAGLAKARAAKPDAIVLDVMMATASEGFDVARALRRDDETKGIPLILLTSVNQTVPFRFEPDPAFLPVDRFLEKPVAPDVLVREVAAAVG